MTDTRVEPLTTSFPPPGNGEVMYQLGQLAAAVEASARESREGREIQARRFDLLEERLEHASKAIVSLDSRMADNEKTANKARDVAVSTQRQLSDHEAQESNQYASMMGHVASLERAVHASHETQKTALDVVSSETVSQTPMLGRLERQNKLQQYTLVATAVAYFIVELLRGLGVH